MSEEKPNRLVAAAIRRAEECAGDKKAPSDVRTAYETIAASYRSDLATAALRRQARIITNAHEAAVRAAKKAQADG